MPELAWLALLDEPAPGSVPVVDQAGVRAEHLLVRGGRAKPHRLAVRIEPSLLGGGPPLAVSLVLPAPDARPLFDDPSVVGAMREVLRDPGRASVFSTLVASSTRWAGSLTGVSLAVAAGWPGWWDGDPFARLGRQRRLLVPPLVFVPRPLPAGPNHQRHAGAPWPWGRFEGAVAPS